MSRGRGGSNKKPSDDEAARLDDDKSHVRVDAARRDESIQAKILKALRSKGERVLQLFHQMDCDKSNSIDKAEFAKRSRHWRFSAASRITIPYSSRGTPIGLAPWSTTNWLPRSLADATTPLRPLTRTS